MSTSSRDHIEQVLEVLRETEQNGLLSPAPEGLSGISGLKTVGALQRLVRLFADDEAACYVEIGVFQGRTLVSAALAAPNLSCFGIDNFATLDPDGKNKALVRERLARFGADNATLIDADFEEALQGLEHHLSGRKVGIYFIDGPHDYRSQMVCLLLAKGHLHENAVIVIDDANYPDVRWSTRDFLLGHSKFKMLFDAYSPAHPANMAADERKPWEEGWLNGVNILVRDPDGLLPDLLPPVDGDRSFYFNEWLVHRLRRAELAPEAVVLADAVLTGDETAEKKARSDLLANDADANALFADRNTYSDGLPATRFTDFLK